MLWEDRWPLSRCVIVSAKNWSPQSVQPWTDRGLFSLVPVPRGALQHTDVTCDLVVKLDCFVYLGPTPGCASVQALWVGAGES